MTEEQKKRRRPQQRNIVILDGNLVADPEVKDFPSGTKLCKIRMGTSNYDGNTTWTEVEFWGKRAEVLEQYGKRGSLIQIMGRLVTEEWVDKDTGKKRSKHIIKDASFEFGPKETGEDVPKRATQKTFEDTEGDDVPF